MATRRKTGNGAAPLRRHSIDFSLGGSLGYLVRDANRAFQRLLERRISPHGVTRGQWYFLRVLWTRDGVSQRELSESVGMMEPTTVIALQSMEKAGLVRRERSAEDKRKAQVWLTPKAKKLKAQLLPVARWVFHTEAILRSSADDGFVDQWVGQALNLYPITIVFHNALILEDLFRAAAGAGIGT